MMATDIGRGSWVVNALMKAGGLLGITRNMSQGAATTLLCTLADPGWLRGQCVARDIDSRLSFLFSTNEVKLYLFLVTTRNASWVQNQPPCVRRCLH